MKCDNCDKKKATHRIRDNERYPDCDLCCECSNCDGEACDVDDEAPEEIVETVRGMSKDIKAEWLGGYPF
jgi:protein-arginine kinase activator protein McsA